MSESNELAPSIFILDGNIKPDADGSFKLDASEELVSSVKSAYGIDLENPNLLSAVKTHGSFTIKLMKANEDNDEMKGGE